MRQARATWLLLASVILGAPSGAAWGAEYRAASSEHAVRLSVAAVCVAPDEPPACDPPARVEIRRRRDGRVVQRIALPHLRVAAGDRGRDVIRLVDLDFDGHADLALPTGREALAGAPSYDVYRFDPASGRFRHDAALSLLSRELSSFFEVDPARRRLIARAHGGSGYESSEYAWRDGRPLRVYRRVVAVETNAPHAGWLRITVGRLRRGRWVEHSWLERPD